MNDNDTKKNNNFLKKKKDFLKKKMSFCFYFRFFPVRVDFFFFFLEMLYCFGPQGTCDTHR